MTHSEFVHRHIGPRADDVRLMLEALNEQSLETFIDDVVPESIRSSQPLNLRAGIGEAEALAELQAIAGRNRVVKSLLGQGYYGCLLPSVIVRNVLEAPGWYTAYTPYQPEIAQGRLEVLFNFQTLITELTALPMANASLLDEATAAAEAMALAHRALRAKRQVILVAETVHPQTLDVMQTRAQSQGIEIQIEPVDQIIATLQNHGSTYFAVLLQYPDTVGEIVQPDAMVEAAKTAGCLVLVATDLLALTLLEPPGNWGADIVIGSAQRFGVPMGFGGPHAAFMATTDAHKRNIPGRLIGQSQTVNGEVGYRLALQTREQHIRREKATSNICTAQALLAIISTFYACYHGPDGLRSIARRVRLHADSIAATLSAHGVTVLNKRRFDTVHVAVEDASAAVARLLAAGFNLRKTGERSVALSVDETTSKEDVAALLGGLLDKQPGTFEVAAGVTRDSADDRSANYLSQACFHAYQSETEMMRYMRRLADKDIALDRAMIPLGSCTMKLNSAAEMAPISWPEFTSIHPFAPADQTRGFIELITDLESMLCACTGYDAVSLQPNAGSQGEYAGLLAIRRYHLQRGEAQRDVCLIPSSAHGTNPASAQMAGLKVVVVACDDAGNIDIDDLRKQLERFTHRVAAIMITYPSTHGVFEVEVRTVCDLVHAAGGQVYLDGANLNAMVGTAQPGHFGGDVSHLNLHKTFCIPHGGGGPGIGPIGVGAHLQPFLPGHRYLGDASGVVSAAAWGSAMILPITWMYIRMMGGAGLRHATQIAILNANYIAERLSSKFPILYRGSQWPRCA